MSSTYSTPVHARTGYAVPTTVNQRTDMNDLPIATSVYLRENGGKVATDTLLCVMEAMRDAAAVVVLYCAGKGDLGARVLWPESVSLTKDKNIVARCYCTLRRENRTFRLDRIVACHALTTPDDIGTV